MTDERGNPMPGVGWVVNCGMGTLRPTGMTTTSLDGRYTLRFKPGFMASGSTEPWPANVPLQAASVYARKAGFYEKNLCRGGDLGMAGKLPEKDGSGWFKNSQIVLPGKPYRLDFVMLPAARMSTPAATARSSRPRIISTWLC